MNYQIKELEKDLINQVSTYVGVITHRVCNEINLKISQKKEPYLREILEATRNGTQLEAKYTASDILTVLEALQESLPTAD